MPTAFRLATLALPSAALLAFAALWLHGSGGDNSAAVMLGAVAALGAAHRFLPRGEPHGVRHERDLVAALGEPLLATHPSGPHAMRALCGPLSTYWLAGGRRVLPLVHFADSEGAARLVVDLARAFAATGRRTLLVDADLRAPKLHERFGLTRARGLADFLEGRPVDFAAVDESLAFLSAGTPHEHPLELLSRERLRHLLRGVAQSFDAVVVYTPSAALGPDFEIFAALAGGALVFAGASTEAGQLAALRRELARCAARVVGTVLERA